jgi:hypothetical protein
MLFDWLVVGHIVDVNPAHAVRGPKFSQKKGRTVLAAEEARTLLDSIAVLRTVKKHGGGEEDTPPETSPHATARFIARLIQAGNRKADRGARVVTHHRTLAALHGYILIDSEVW